MIQERFEAVLNRGLLELDQAENAVPSPVQVWLGWPRNKARLQKCLSQVLLVNFWTVVA